MVGATGFEPATSPIPDRGALARRLDQSFYGRRAFPVLDLSLTTACACPGLMDLIIRHPPGSLPARGYILAAAVFIIAPQQMIGDTDIEAFSRLGLQDVDKNHDPLTSP
jgi:hypothetical protein